MENSNEWYVLMKENAIKQLKELSKDELNTNNIQYIEKLLKIHKYLEEEEKEMRYSEYGNYNEYGRDSYGRRGVDSRYREYNAGGNYHEYGRRRYRGDEALDGMYENYGRYNESRGRYGAGDESNKSYHYMVKALEDFIKVLEEEAETPEQRQMLQNALQNSMR